MRIDLANYIEAAKRSGMSNKRIYEGLLLTGWGEGNPSPFSGPSAETPPKSQQQMTSIQKKIAIFFLVALVGLFGAFVYAKKLALENYNKVSVAALEAQQKTEEIKQKRFQNSTAIFDPVAGWQTYRNDEYGFELKYPNKLHLKEDRYTVVLDHGIPYKNNGDCDMIGDGGKTYETLTDFSMSLEILGGNLSPKVADGQYQNGKLNGTWYYSGSEGCGEYLYYFPIGADHTLEIRRAAIQATSGLSTVWDINKILNIDDSISNDESKQIFNQILSTFRFTK